MFFVYTVRCADGRLCTGFVRCRPVHGMGDLVRRWRKQPFPGENGAGMSFCDHCDGQRFDRSRTLRALRRELRECAPQGPERDAILRALKTIRALDIPHLERLTDDIEGELIH